MVVPTYPEGGCHALGPLQVCQHHHQVVRVGHFVGLSETQRTRCSRLLRPIRLKPFHGNTAHIALYVTVKVAGGVLPYPFGAESRVTGDKFNQTPIFCCDCNI